MYVNRITGSTPNQGSSGLFYRSTDDGSTWQTMTTPPFKNDFDNYFSVTAHGSIVYVLDGAHNLWRTTDGGDGTLGSYMDSHVTHLSYASSALTSGGDTLRSAL